MDEYMNILYKEFIIIYYSFHRYLTVFEKDSLIDQILLRFP